MLRLALIAPLALALLTNPAAAAEERLPVLDVPPAWAAPFVLVLLAIAILPLVVGHFWHANRNKALVMALLAAPVVVYLVRSGPDYVHTLQHVLIEYVSFIILLWSLYTVSGGIVLRGDLSGRPATNVVILAVGAVLANFIGTTGASMLLIRPYLRINRQRKHVHHLPVFFIFVVSNLGGLLTPLGDPPLFLGFLRGVEFFWTTEHLWQEWLVANGIVLAVFLVWDTIAYLREGRRETVRDAAEIQPLRIEGLRNLLFLAGILVAVLLQSPQVADLVRDWLGQFVACPDLTLRKPWGETLMVAMGVLAYLATPGRLRQANGFSWGPIVEVAVLFAGIFVTMVPALELLRKHGPGFGIDQPWQYFWLTGGLSSFLDNAPTYLTFATMAAGEHPIHWLMGHEQGTILAAIGCGAVFMGANTYIGNGPNFMVKAIADEAGMPAPSFFGYMVYSGLILLPVFALITFLFFVRPGRRPGEAVMIWFTCKQCGKRHGRPDETSGSLLFCECGHGNRVPWESTVPAPETPPPERPAPRGPRPGPEWRPDIPRPALGIAQPAALRDPGRCLNHQDLPSEQKCAACGEMFCADCVIALQGQTLCGPCKNYRLAQLARPPRISGLAIAALLVGLVSAPAAFFVSAIPFGQPQGPSAASAAFGLAAAILPLAGLVVGFLALREIEGDPRVGDRALAMTGTAAAALGALWCVAIVLVLIGRQMME